MRIAFLLFSLFVLVQPVLAQQSDTLSVTGEILSYSNRELTIRDDDGSVHTVTLPPNTDIFVNSVEGSELDIVPGTRATVSITPEEPRVVLLPLTSSGATAAFSSLIVGIVVVLVFLGVMAFLIWRIFASGRRRQQPPQNNNNSGPSAPSPEPLPPSQTAQSEVPIPYT